MDIIERKCIQDGYRKLEALANPSLLEVIAQYVSLCSPKSIYICSDSAEDSRYIRQRALEVGEEKALATPGHTVHYDGYFDQARDKEVTKYLLSQGEYFSKHINSTDREKGIQELREYLKDSMVEKEMIVGFFCLGPLDSEFSLLALQITDSYYVLHSEKILYRSAYELFKRKQPRRFFRFIHSAGEIVDGVSKNVDKRRIYIDLKEHTVYSVNTQYAGNTVGLKKLALRLAIKKASCEGWLAEHMFLMGVIGNNERKTYFVGAFPSGCGKTSTAMLKDETIVGDDIAYLRVRDGKVCAVNVEKGIFGIIQDVSKESDPLIWEAVTSPGEVIITNVLVTKEGIPRWLGDGRPPPLEGGTSFSGYWSPGKRDLVGKDIPYAHKNARYTVEIASLDNCDSHLNNPGGVEVGGVIYGGRDSDTWPPVCESFNWSHGVITFGAALESELTSATLGQEGQRKFNPFSNLDFLSIPIGEYIDMHLQFVNNVTIAPKIFAVNYFLKDEQGEFLNTKGDKHIWLKWMEQRVHGERAGIKTAIGYIPLYEDLKVLFKQILGKEYLHAEYLAQFSIRVEKNLAKIEKIKGIYQDLSKIPPLLFDILEAQKKRLEETREQFGDIVPPETFQKLWKR